MKEYNYKFGILSALGIVFVVLGHFDNNILSVDGWFDYYSFHMPLFIFISGYFFNEHSAENIGGYVIKKIKKLLIPFYSWNLIYLTIQTLIAQVPKLWGGNGFEIGYRLSLYNLLIYPWENEQPRSFHIASWFLIALFLVELYNIVIEWICRKLKHRNEIVILMMSLIISIIGILLIQNGVAGFVKILSRSMYCLFFFRLGHWYKVYGEERDKLNSTVYFVILFIVQFLFKVKYGDNLTFGVWGGIDFDHIPVLIVVPILGIMFWLRVAGLLTPLLKEVKWFVFLGKNTMSIMIHHLFAKFLIQMVIYIISLYTSLFSSFDVARFKSEVYYIYAPYEGMTLFYTIASIALVLAAIYVKDRIKLRSKRNNLR